MAARASKTVLPSAPRATLEIPSDGPARAMRELRHPCSDGEVAEVGNDERRGNDVESVGDREKEERRESKHRPF